MKFWLIIAGSLLIFGLADPENIVRGVQGEKIGTVVTL